MGVFCGGEMVSSPCDAPYALRPTPFGLMVKWPYEIQGVAIQFQAEAG